MKKKIRIIDIADELGVSTATVSNVIYGKTKKISDATVRRVQEKLVERGYIPNMAATLLSQNNSRIVGVVVNNQIIIRNMKDMFWKTHTSAARSMRYRTHWKAMAIF